VFGFTRSSRGYVWYVIKGTCASVLVPTITNIVNFCLTSGQFHSILKESVISPLLKKSTLDKCELSNYLPISNLSVISKIIERVVKSHNYPTSVYPNNLISTLRPRRYSLFIRRYSCSATFITHTFIHEWNEPSCLYSAAAQSITALWLVISRPTEGT